MGIFAVAPRGQHEKFRQSIEREVMSLESLIVPGLSATAVNAIRDKVLALESKLAPTDDKRDPRHFKTKPAKTREYQPCYLWSAQAWNTAVWAARKRADNGCELCGERTQGTIARLWNLPPNTPITKEHVECVCPPCASRTPRPEYFDALR